MSIAVFAATLPKLFKEMPPRAESGKNLFFSALPEDNFRVLLAAISMFLPAILMLPLGADTVMPVKALSVTSPMADSIFTVRSSDEAEISYRPYWSRNLMPPERAAQLALSSRLSGHTEVGNQLLRALVMPNQL